MRNIIKKPGKEGCLRDPIACNKNLKTFLEISKKEVGEEGGRGRDAATQSDCVLLAGAQAEGQVVSLLLTVRPGQSPPPQSEDLFI